MKLALALNERAELATAIDELSERLNKNALMQENERPAEDPAELLRQLGDSLVRFEELTTRINHTISITQVKGKPLTACMAQHESLKKRLSVMNSFLKAASQRVDVSRQRVRISPVAYGLKRPVKELKVSSTVSVPDLRKQVDAWNEKMRLLDQEIQAVNWQTDLV